MTVPDGSPWVFDVAALKQWAKITRTDDDALLGVVVAAVRAFVDSLPDAPRTPEGGWADSTHLAALMLAARLDRRRNSPSGVESFTDLGATYVSRQDPDVASLLRIGPATRPRVG